MFAWWNPNLPSCATRLNIVLFRTDLRIKIIAGNIASVSFVSSWKELIHRYSRINDWARLKVFHWIQFAIQTFYASYPRHLTTDLKRHPLLKCATGDDFKSVSQSWSDYETYCCRQNNVSFSSLSFFLSLSQINWPRYCKIWINIKRPSANIVDMNRECEIKILVKILY